MLFPNKIDETVRERERERETKIQVQILDKSHKQASFDHVVVFI
jgi:hypothetical protein